MAIPREDIENLLVRIGGRREEAEGRAKRLLAELQELLLSAAKKEGDPGRIRRVADNYAIEAEQSQLLQEFSHELRTLLM